MAGDRVGGTAIAGDISDRSFGARRTMAARAVGRARDGSRDGDVPSAWLYRQGRRRTKTEGWRDRLAHGMACGKAGQSEEIET